MEAIEVKTEIDSVQDLKKVAFQCSQCDKVVQSSSNLKTHMKWIHELVRDRHICEVCCKTFAIAKDLKNHQMVHTGERNFPCHICGKSYQKKDYLIRHTRIHTGEKPYSCEHCGKSFSDPSSFKGHTRSHTDTFACSICGKVLLYEKSLKLHLKVHQRLEENGEGKKQLFSNEVKVEALKKVNEIGLMKTSVLMKIQQSSLRNWVNLGKGGHQCGECQKVFPYKASLEKHMLKKHNKSLESEKGNESTIKQLQVGSRLSNPLNVVPIIKDMKNVII